MTNNLITTHYATEGIRERLDHALSENGYATGSIDPNDLAGLDQFHAGGIESTREVGRFLELTGSESVLDVGSGLGGPARFLAANFGCRVTGIDLTPEYVEIANYLTLRTGLSEQVKFVVGSATELPYEDEAFNAAYSQHVGMNIEDKPRLYSEIYRVLRSGSTFVVFDILRNEDGPLDYPLPWASSPSTSFVIEPKKLRHLLGEAGFQDIQETDLTGMVSESFGRPRPLSKQGPAPELLTLANLLGRDSGLAFRNLANQIRSGRLRAVLVAARKRSGRRG